ncbi:MAG: ATP-binding protein [Desulfuromonadaceae bacterium]|nr:ATP-binding protein [Desulfuromonadaceae bacterium]MDD5107132.1 ATP-binding protein [Desulfuromonadaceae bacterium]
MDTKPADRLNLDRQTLIQREKSILFSPLRLIIILVLCIFTVEFFFMVLLHNLPMLSPVAEFLLDAFLLSVALCPVLIFMLFRPLKHLVAQYQINEQQLITHKEQLELEVKSRTAELDQVVLQLRSEISEKDIIKDVLSSNSDLLEAIIESIASPLFIKDKQGLYKGCNTLFSDYIGLTKEQIIGSSVFEVAPAELAAVYHRADMDLMESRGTQTYESQVRYADGTLHDIVFNKSTILDGDGQVSGLVGVMLDLTALKQAEKEKEQLTQSLLHSQKIESIGRLAAGLAHDFNNLLTPILGYAEMIRKSSESDERTTKRVNGIIDAATKARDLNRQLLAFGRKQLLDMKVLDLNQVIESFNSILSRTVRGDITITLRLDSTLGSIMADKGQLEQVLMNLAINAQDAISNNGKLIIETSNITLSQPHIGNFNLKPGDYVMLVISDNGSGMDAETVNHIFEPFYTTKEVGHGTGLGLATVYGIICQHGGSINVYSEPGYGSTFKLYFPRLDERPQVELIAEKVEERTQYRGHTILLVEDNDMVREVTRELLENVDFTVLEANGAKQATQLLKRHGKPIDLLISDVIMPDKNGPIMYEVLKELQTDLKVLYMSGYSESIISLQGMGNDSPNYIRKPFTPDALLHKIDMLISHNQDDFTP